jgi:hypothetical protein
MPQIMIDVGGTAVDIRDLTVEEINKLIEVLNDRKQVLDREAIIRKEEDKLWDIVRKNKKRRI